LQHVTGALKELGCDDLRDHAAAVGMMKMAQPLLALKERYPGQLVVRVSLDHYSRSLHELERGPRSWGPAFAGLKWLIDEGFVVHVLLNHPHCARFCVLGGASCSAPG